MNRRHRWELDPASSEDYHERLRRYDAYRAGDSFRQWLNANITRRPDDASTPRTARRASAGRDS